MEAFQRRDISDVASSCSSLAQLQAALGALGVESVLVTRHRLTLDGKMTGGGIRHPPSTELHVISGRCQPKVTVTGSKFQAGDAYYPTGDPVAASTCIAATVT